MPHDPVSADTRCPTPAIDADNAAVVAFAHAHASRSMPDRQRAVSLFYAVRDTIRYDPYTIRLTTDGMRASTTLNAGRGWCVAKAVLLAACCRSMDLPARLGFADVRNHLATRRLRELMKTDVFYWHGYTEIYIEDRWIKATPAFNRELCQRFNLKPLEFDGRSDAIFHPFDLSGNTHMEYIRYRGEFPDLPLAQIKETFNRHYGVLLDQQPVDFTDEVIREKSDSA